MRRVISCVPGRQDEALRALALKQQQEPLGPQQQQTRQPEQARQQQQQQQPQARGFNVAELEKYTLLLALLVIPQALECKHLKALSTLC